MIEAKEVVKGNKVEITLTFDKADYDFFSLDKGDPKEWIRNACDANNSRRKKLLKREIAETVTVTDADVEAKIAKMKAEKNQGSKEEV